MTPSIVFFTFYLYFDVILHFTFSVNLCLTMKVKYEREKKQILKNEGKREGASIVV